MKKTKSASKRIAALKLLPLLFLLIVGAISAITLHAFFSQTTFSRREVFADSVNTITLAPQSFSDIANEDGSQFTQPGSNGETVWFGTGKTPTKSYLGIRFSGAVVPRGATIQSALIQLTPKDTTWIGVSTLFGVELGEMPSSFSRSSRPSSRILSTVTHSEDDNVQWIANTKYSYDITQPIQSLGTLTDRGVYSVIIKGTSPNSWGRKFVLSGIGGSVGPKLVITYRLSTTATPQPTSVPGTSVPTTRPTAIATPTVKPTVTPTMPPMPMPGTTGNAASYGLWDPADAKYAVNGPQKYPTCTKAFHDSFYVIANDGKKYPTWHPPVAVDPTTGVKCAFGHEHGRDPKKSALWAQIQQHFYYDANKNGVMDPAEQAVAGVPFGFANEQLDVYSSALGLMTMRHEDHVGHKIEYANGEADTDGGSFNTNTTGGVIVPIQTGNPSSKWADSGARCYYFTKVHQGVSTFDAFTNNIHEVIYFSDCKGPNSGYDQKVALTEMVAFGAPGEFTNLCTAEEDRTTPVVLGKDAMNSTFPGRRSSGTRSIIQRNCIEKYFLVPEGQYSMNMYEEWDQSMGVTMATGKTILSGINLAFDVEEANRYYYPGKPNNLGYSMDLCYESIGGRRAHTSVCDSATNYGTIKGITWNDTRSGFKGIHRGNYFMPAQVNNQGGAEIVYTDPYGGNGKTTPFPGSIKQLVPAKNIDYSKLGPTDPRQVDTIHDDGEGTVHAPN